MSDNEQPDKTVPVTETIKLSFPIEINGVKTDRLVMRRAKLKDVRNASKVAGNDEEEQEIRLFSLLTDCAPSDLEELDYADYSEIQETFRRMVKRRSRSQQNSK